MKRITIAPVTKKPVAAERKRSKIALSKKDFGLVLAIYSGLLLSGASVLLNAHDKQKPRKPYLQAIYIKPAEERVYLFFDGHRQNRRPDSAFRRVKTPVCPNLSERLYWDRFSVLVSRRNGGCQVNLVSGAALGSFASFLPSEKKGEGPSGSSAIFILRPNAQQAYTLDMKPQTLSLKLDLRIISLILLAIIAGMLALWRPWSADASDARKITINGSASVKAVPDEFLFYPTFERKGTDTAVLKDELNAFGTKLQNDLKAIGVDANDITLNSDSYQDYNAVEPAIAPDTRPTTNGQVVTLRVTINVPTKELAQKVQDHLAKTDAKGSLTAQPSFSEAKRKEVENDARQKAIEDARNKAGQTASTLDAKLGKVLEVKDQSGFDQIMPGVALDTSMKGSGSLPVTPGREAVSVTVQVVFSLK